MGTDALEQIGMRFLTPQNCNIFVGRLCTIHCVVSDAEAYANVYCLRCFAISHPDRFIQVSHTNDEGKEREIGVIEDLSVFPAETQALIRSSLRRQYYEQVIVRIDAVRSEFGLLFFDVTTESGEARSFTMRWQQDKAVEYGAQGKVLLDVFDNRYVIPSVEGLPTRDRTRLVRYIYW